MRQFKAGTVDIPLSTQMALGSVPGAILGVITLKHLEATLGDAFDTVIFTLLAGALLLTGTALLARILLVPRLDDRERETVELTARERWVRLGARALRRPGHRHHLRGLGRADRRRADPALPARAPPRRRHGPLPRLDRAVVGGDRDVFAGDIDYGLAGTLLIGAIPGVWIASRLSLVAPVGALRLGLAVVLLGAGLGMLQKAGVGIPDGVMVVAPALTITVVAGAALRQSAPAHRPPGHQRAPPSA